MLTFFSIICRTHILVGRQSASLFREVQVWLFPPEKYRKSFKNMGFWKLLLVIHGHQRRFPVITFLLKWAVSQKQGCFSNYEKLSRYFPNIKKNKEEQPLWTHSWLYQVIGVFKDAAAYCSISSLGQALQSRADLIFKGMWKQLTVKNRPELDRVMDKKKPAMPKHFYRPGFNAVFNLQGNSIWVFCSQGSSRLAIAYLSSWIRAI